MNRKEFLQKIFLLPLVISTTNKTEPPKETKTKENLVLWASYYVRGFSYYHGHDVLGQMQLDDYVTLVREPSNRHDDQAIQINFRNKKIGYIPRECNSEIAKLMDLGLMEFVGKIEKLQPEEEDYRKVKIGIYALKKQEKSSLSYNSGK
ncbi:MAG: HIRAN domain-containing protein [Chitinophagales bacterium]|jgi:hypothetical protein|nr:HIRAN domain-containing protein [Chitinophagales bacterium]